MTQLNPRQSVTYGYVVRIPIRGLFEIGPTKVILRDRMGFYATEGEIKTKTEILVYPSYEDIKKLELIGRKRQLGVLFGFHRTKLKGMGSDFWGIRKYQTGDPFKFIDWKAFSRSGKMMVREYESEENIRSLPYLYLPRNTSIKEVIWSKTDIVTLLTSSIEQGKANTTVFRLDIPLEGDFPDFIKQTYIKDITDIVKKLALESEKPKQDKRKKNT